jgi:RNA recognition motif-containing protein
VVVTSLPNRCSKAELENAFQGFGTLVAMRNKFGFVPDNGNYKSVVFITFGSEAEAQKAVDADTVMVGTRRVKRKISETQPKSKTSTGSIAFFVGNIPDMAGPQQIRNVFQKHGVVLSVRLAPAKQAEQQESWAGGLQEEQDGAEGEQESTGWTKKGGPGDSQEQQPAEHKNAWEVEHGRTRKGFETGVKGNHGGFAWVIFQEGHVDGRALLKLDKKVEVMGRTVRIKKAQLKDKTSRTVAAKKISTSKRKKQLAEERAARAASWDAQEEDYAEYAVPEAKEKNKKKRGGKRERKGDQDKKEQQPQGVRQGFNRRKEAEQQGEQAEAEAEAETTPAAGDADTNPWSKNVSTGATKRKEAPGDGEEEGESGETKKSRKKRRKKGGSTMLIQQTCMLFQSTGTCPRGADCPFVHE